MRASKNVHAHDFRHLLKTFLAEQRVEKEVRDLITHHGISRIEGTYNSAKRLPYVRKALQLWADHVEEVGRGAGEGAASKVVAISQKA